MRSSATRLLFVCLASLVAFSATGATLTGIVPPSAPHGARVLLAGSGLDAPDLVVTFSDGSGNPVTAAIVASTAKTAEVVVPSAAASGLVQASAAGTTFGTASFTLLSDPAFTSVRTLALSDKSNDVFKALGGVALEPNGIVVIADTAHNVVSIMAPGSAPTVLAGTPSKSGFQDGSGAQALFKQPAAVAYDAARNLIYVADTGNNAIRTVAADGTVSTIASAAAQFKAPQAIAVDANGNLLVADTGNSEIRLVTPSGSVSTLAGSLHSGFADGAVSQALFNAPSGIAVDRDGAVYVADAGNNRIRKIANGSVTTIAGTAQQGWADGPAAFAQFKLPGGIAVDDAGNIYVSDTANNVIRLISGGNVSTIAGNGKQGLIDGSPVAASFKAPAGLAYGGGVFVADSGNDAVRLLVPELKFSAVYPASGPEAGGNSVRLFGSGFVNGLTSVAVNGANVSATFVTSTELLIPSMPSGTATVSMAITTPAGTVQLSNCYTYLPPPTVATVQPNKGKTAGGDVVTITGTNFGSIDDTSVTFGSTAATVTSVTSASIAVTTPAGSAGTVDVTVSTPGGSATRSSAFTYLDPPTIASIAPTAGKTAGGDGITATGTNFDDTTTTLTIGGVPATNVVVVSPTSLTATTPAGSAGPVNVAVTTAGGSAMLSGGFTYVPPPVIASFTPTSGTAGSNVTITGQNFATVAANDTVTIGGAAAAVVSATATQLIVTVPANAISGAIAVTAIGGTATSATPFTVITYRSLAVTSPVTSLQPATQQQFTAIVTLVDNTTRDVTSSATWSSSNPTVASVSSTGLVSAATSGAADISATFSGLSATLHVVVQSGFGLPPATMQGPPLDPTIISPLADTIRFLYTGPNAIQTGVAANTIDDNRSAVISGRVTDRSGAAVPGVQVTVAQHPEYAETLTRVDGRYDLAFNGGGPLHLIFSKSGFLPADRLVTTKWNQQKTIDDVALVAYDTAVTTITSNPPVPQVAQGSLSSDTDGNRRATMYFPPGVAATLINADGTTQAATTLHVRATEYTVGPNGPKAMPAVLPPNSGYTYCVELSVDEAPGVTFSQSVPVYVENFLGFPVGSVVPVGYFDRTKDLWVPALNGVVIKIVSVTNGAAALDTDGDGNPDTQDRLTALGIDTNELRQLGSLYTTGQTLWRVQVDHFTPWDMNWPYGPPSDAVSPLPPPPDTS
ncbi:MAG TPA: IPT/TIG domain-containing protein, partial [Thermoanaerobaculia bacterium]|nr:IPT/TIG domain-containing protein [Thermoanaerobaculia bacterium]